MFLHCPIGHDPRKILDKLRQLSGSEICSAFQPEYVGLETQEDLERWRERDRDRHRDELYQDVLRYVLGKPGRFEAFNGLKGAIAKDLIAKDPELAFDKDALLGRVAWEYGMAMEELDEPLT